MLNVSFLFIHLIINIVIKDYRCRVQLAMSMCNCSLSVPVQLKLAVRSEGISRCRGRKHIQVDRTHAGPICRQCEVWKHSRIHPHTLSKHCGKSTAHVQIICIGRAEFDRVVTHTKESGVCATGPSAHKHMPVQSQVKKIKRQGFEFHTDRMFCYLLSLNIIPPSKSHGQTLEVVQYSTEVTALSSKILWKLCNANILAKTAQINLFSCLRNDFTFCLYARLPSCQELEGKTDPKLTSVC